MLPKLEVIPHRYTDHIGGSCIEVSCGSHSLLLDLGQPLHDPSAGIPEIDYSRVLGIILSHSHQDHTGLAACAPSHIPVWAHPAVQVQMEQLSRWGLGTDRPPINASLLRTFETNKQFEIGPFTVTALAVDHSGFASHGFLVEVADGQRVFYTGDFRAHGRTGFRFERLLNDLKSGVDTLVSEGTTLGRPGAEQAWTEEQVQASLTEICKRTAGPVLLWAATGNVDRMVSAWKSARDSGRDFAPDMYTSDLLERLSCWAPSLPHLSCNHDHYRTLITPQWLRRATRFNLLQVFRRTGIRRISYKSLSRQNNWSKVLLLTRPGLLRDLEPFAEYLRGGTLVYSLWSGYREQPEYDDFIKWCEGKGMQVVTCHSGGHADPVTLQRLAENIPHKKFIRVHTEVSACY